MAALSRVGHLAHILCKPVASAARGADGSVTAFAAVLRPEQRGGEARGRAGRHGGTGIAFTTLVLEQPARFLGFIKEIVGALPRNYHLAVVPRADVPRYLRPGKGKLTVWDLKEIMAWSQGAGSGSGDDKEEQRQSGGDFVLFGFGHDADEARTAPSFKNSPSDPVRFQDRNGRSIEPEGGVTFGDLRVGSSARAMATLDAQGRNMFVVVMKEEGVREMSQLDDSGLLDLWSTAVRAAEAAAPETAGMGTSLRSSEKVGVQIVESAARVEVEDRFSDLRINAGLYQNIGHLHLKCSMPAGPFFDRWVAYWPWRRLMSATPSKSLRDRCLKHVEKVEAGYAAQAGTTGSSVLRRFWTEDNDLRESLGLDAVVTTEPEAGRRNGGGSSDDSVPGGLGLLKVAVAVGVWVLRGEPS